MNKLKEDLDYIIKEARSSLEFLDGKKLFITGGTGFFGKWLLETLIWANQQGYNIKVGVLSRNPDKFKLSYPHLCKGIVFYKGDITDFNFPEESYDYLIHAATQASAQLNKENPWLMFNDITFGTRRILEFSKMSKVKRILNISSGAVYGIQPPELEKIPESCSAAPSTMSPSSAYGEGKRASELMGTIFSEKEGIQFVSARCFAFSGPYLPLDTDFAIGNFVLNAINGEDIIIKGDGSTVRSYLYAADLVVWLLMLMERGVDREAYNVGSDQSLSILDLALEVQKFAPSVDIKVLGVSNGQLLPSRYVPNTEKATSELSLKAGYSINKSIQRMIDSIR